MAIASTGLRCAGLGDGRNGAAREAHAEFFSAISAALSDLCVEQATSPRHWPVPGGTYVRFHP